MVALKWHLQSTLPDHAIKTYWMACAIAHLVTSCTNVLAHCQRATIDSTNSNVARCVPCTLFWPLVKGELLTSLAHFEFLKILQ